LSPRWVAGNGETMCTKKRAGPKSSLGSKMTPFSGGKRGRGGNEAGGMVAWRLGGYEGGCQQGPNA